MNGKINRGISPPPPHCGRRQIKMGSETMGIIRDSSTDLVEQIDIAGTGLQMRESMSREWTDEKHCLYLNSMEASFVRQLNSHEYRSVGLLSQHSTLVDPPDPSSLYSNANNSIPSSQFKVLQGGSWKGVSFKRTQPKLHRVDDSRLLENQWIQHFRSAGKQQVVLSNMQENSGKSSESICSEGQKKTFHEAATYSKELHAGMHHQNSVDSSTEVSDQNFVDDEHEGETTKQAVPDKTRQRR